MSPEYSVSEKELQPRYPIFRVDGTVGVGKTSLAGPLAEALGAYLLEEPYVKNPSLKKFYTEDPKKYAFDTQMFFMEQDAFNVSRLAEIVFTKPVVLDAGEDVNARTERVQHRLGWISDRQHEIYNKTRRKLYRNNPLAKADIHFALTGKTETVLGRILSRKRRMELLMHKKHPEYFVELAKEYEVWLKRAKKGPRIVKEIDTEKFNIVSKWTDRTRVLQQALIWSGYYLTSEHQLNLTGRDGRPLTMPDVFRDLNLFSQNSVPSIQ